LCLDARCSYPSTIFFCYLWTSSFMFAT
jgi:hypothetical protein